MAYKTLNGFNTHSGKSTQPNPIQLFFVLHTFQFYIPDFEHFIFMSFELHDIGVFEIVCYLHSTTFYWLWCETSTFDRIVFLVQNKWWLIPWIWLTSVVHVRVWVHKETRTTIFSIIEFHLHRKRKISEIFYTKQFE